MPTSGPHDDRPIIEITPRAALADEPLRIRVLQAQPDTPVVLRATMRDARGGGWAASATFRSNGDGVVDLARQAPASGSYAGADPMGMLWSMEPAPVADGAPVEPPDPLAPTTIRFVLEIDGAAVAETAIERRKLAPGMTRRVVRERGLVGTLFQPDGPGPYPGVILVGGAEGGMHEVHAALLAAHGYAVLALAYFGMEGVPPGLVSIPLEYFETAAGWLQAQPGVRDDRLGVIGGSRGGELALLLGATFPVFTAVVSSLGSGVMTQGIAYGDLMTMINSAQPSWTYRGQPLPYLPSSATPAFEEQVRAGGPAELGLVFQAALEDRAAVEAALIPVERTRGAVLLISAEDDRSWPSAQLSRMAEERLARHQHPYDYQHLCYERAGHGIIAPPYGPTTARLAPGPGVMFVMGGATVDDAFARADAWRQTLAFFAQHLREG